MRFSLWFVLFTHGVVLEFGNAQTNFLRIVSVPLPSLLSVVVDAATHKQVHAIQWESVSQKV